jgi:RHS repeat-associated protein
MILYLTMMRSVADRLTRIDYPDETYSAYKYDALGRRIEKRDRSGTIRRYVYDGHNMVAEYDGGNTLLASYVQGLRIDDPVSMYRNGGMYWYHKDALGSIYQMTDEDEVTVRSYDYSAFGTIVAETGARENPFTYTAREYDADSGLYYYRARYYDAGVGRFLGRDVDTIEQKKNLYVYVENNPLLYVDPLGLHGGTACLLECVRECVNSIPGIAYLIQLCNQGVAITCVPPIGIGAYCLLFVCPFYANNHSIQFGLDHESCVSGHWDCSDPWGEILDQLGF